MITAFEQDLGYSQADATRCARDDGRLMLFTFCLHTFFHFAYRRQHSFIPKPRNESLVTAYSKRGRSSRSGRSRSCGKRTTSFVAFLATGTSSMMKFRPCF